MSNTTTNYNLAKPLQSESYNVDVQNGNMDIIDGTLKGHATQLSDVAHKTGILQTNLNSEMLGGKKASDFSKVFSGSIADFNTSLTQGEFTFNSSTINGAMTGAFGKVIIIVSDGTTHDNSSNWIWQIAYITSGIIWFRSKANNGSWTQWKQVATTENVDVLSLLLNGWTQPNGFSDITICKVGNLKTIIGWLKVGSTGVILNLPANVVNANVYQYKIGDTTNSRYGMFTVNGNALNYISGNLLTTDYIFIDINYI